MHKNINLFRYSWKAQKYYNDAPDICLEAPWTFTSLIMSTLFINAIFNFSPSKDQMYNESCVQKLMTVQRYDDYDTTTGLSSAYTRFLDGLQGAYPNITGGFYDLTHTEVQGYNGFSGCKRLYTTASEEYFE